MDLDEILPKRAGDPLAALIVQDLDPLSVKELEARIVALELQAAFHTDKWCADHHLGEGPSTCIKHSGCCYDGRIGICHSCDAHSDAATRTADPAFLPCSACGDLAAT